MDREGMQLSNKAWLIYKDGHNMNLSWSDIKVKTENWHGCFEINYCFGLKYTVFVFKLSSA